RPARYSTAPTASVPPINAAATVRENPAPGGSSAPSAGSEIVTFGASKTIPMWWNNVKIRTPIRDVMRTDGRDEPETAYRMRATISAATSRMTAAMSPWIAAGPHASPARNRGGAGSATGGRGGGGGTGDEACN